MNALGRSPRARHRPSSDDRGFTLIEVSVAFALLALLAATMIPVFAGALMQTGASEQRRTATQLMNQAMEAVRALPFSTVANGLDSGDVTSNPDPLITVAGSTYTFSNGEEIPHGDLDYTVEPLVPHRSTHSVGDATFTVSVYPTKFEGSSTTLRITAIVEWEATYKPGGRSSIRTESIIYSDPTGCISSATHPFSAPCQPFLYATAAPGTSSFVIKPIGGASGPAFGSVDLVRASLELASPFSTLQVEQITSVNARSVTGAARIETATIQSTGGLSAPAGVDDDPGSASSTSASSNATQISTPVSVGDGTNSLTLTPGASDTGAATSTITASASPSCQGVDGAALLSGKPCGASSASITSAEAVLALTAGSTSLGTTRLLSVGASPQASRSFISRHFQSHPDQCTGTSGDGCVHAASKRTFGTVDLVGLPQRIIDDGVAPVGWAAGNYLVRLSNYGDQVEAEHGINAGSPTATQFAASGSGTPSLSYWNGSGYTTVNVTWGATPPTITIPPINITDAAVPGGVTVTIEATIETGAALANTAGASGCDESCSASATVASPIIADIDYTVTHNGETLAALNMRLDLGTNSATTSYRAAPSAG
jgi:prepilin-type N-terminal cleavage/methylation domain-containing protein